jgi:MFS family permease
VHPSRDGRADREAWHDAALAPLRTRVFLEIWIASFGSNLGTLVHGVGASWLMASLVHSSEMVAFVQASSALPVMLLSVTAGALADVWDRRALMLVAQCLMVATATLLTVLAFGGAVTPWLLLGFTFLLGCGSAIYAPAWQSSVGEQVPLPQLPAAVALNSIGFNIARTVGPALGGALVAAAGPPFAFLLNAASNVGLVVVLARWRRPPRPSALPPESVATAIRVGLRYARLSPAIRTVLLRALVFGTLASALWAMLPLVARDLLGGGPLVYGFLLAVFGGGAVLAGLASTWLRRRYGSDSIVTVSAVASGIATVLIAQTQLLAVSLLVLPAAGAAWVLTFSTLNIATQTAAPRWVAGRTLAFYQTAAFGGLALGSWLWGVYAEHGGLVASLTVAGGLLCATPWIARRWPLHPIAAAHSETSAPGSEDPALPGIEAQAGPVAISIEYRIAPAGAAAYMRAMQAIGRARRRHGAANWTLLQDVDEPTLWVERFETATWADHVRQARGAVVSDPAAFETMLRLHQGTDPPRVRHRLARSPDEFVADGGA